MGNKNTLNKNTLNINYDKIYTIDEVFDLMDSAKNDYMYNGDKFAQKLMYDLNTSNPPTFKIFVCNEICENDFDGDDDDDDNEIWRQNVAEDYILSHGKYQYYVAEICLKMTGSFLSLSNIIWQILPDVMSLSCHIVKYHKNYDDFKQYVILNYVLPDRNKRFSSNKKYQDLNYDLYTILNTLKNTTATVVHDHVCGILNKKQECEEIKKMCKLNDFCVPTEIKIFLHKYHINEKLKLEKNKKIDGFYDNNDPVPIVNADEYHYYNDDDVYDSVPMVNAECVMLIELKKII